GIAQLTGLRIRAADGPDEPAALGGGYLLSAHEPGVRLRVLHPLQGSREVRRGCFWAAAGASSRGCEGEVRRILDGHSAPASAKEKIVNSCDRCVFPRVTPWNME